MTPSAASALDLADHVVERAADLAAPHRGHDAERARVVAADLDRDPPGVRHLAARRQRAGERRVVVGRGLLEDLDDRPAGGPLLAEQLGGPTDVVGAEHHVDVGRPLDDEVAVLLGQAPADHDLQVGAIGLERLELPEVAVELVVGVLADAARVEDDDVGVVDARRRAEARRPRAGRRCARSRARSSGTRRCGRRRSCRSSPGITGWAESAARRPPEPAQATRPTSPDLTSKRDAGAPRRASGCEGSRRAAPTPANGVPLGLLSRRG